MLKKILEHGEVVFCDGAGVTDCAKKGEIGGICFLRQKLFKHEGKGIIFSLFDRSLDWTFSKCVLYSLSCVVTGNPKYLPTKA